MKQGCVRHRIEPLPACWSRQIAPSESNFGIGDAAIWLAFNDVSLRAYREHLYLLGELPDAGDTIPWRGESVLRLPDGLELYTGDAFPEITSMFAKRPVCWQWRRGGESIRLPGRSHRTKLKKAFQERGVPDLGARRIALSCERQ